MNKQPEVTAQTRRNFIDAFWTLAKQKPVTRITVGEITKEAGYNRSTFYAYFTDMPDLIARVEEEMIQELHEALQSYQLPDASDSTFTDGGNVSDWQTGGLPFPDIFKDLFGMLNEKMYCLLGPNGDPTFYPRLKAEVLPQLCRLLGVRPDLPHIDYIISYAYSAIIGYLQHWHDSGKDLPADEFCRIGYALMRHGVLGVAMLVRET